MRRGLTGLVVVVVVVVDVDVVVVGGGPVETTMSTELPGLTNVPGGRARRRSTRPVLTLADGADG